MTILTITDRQHIGRVLAWSAAVCGLALAATEMSLVLLPWLARVLVGSELEPSALVGCFTLLAGMGVGAATATVYHRLVLADARPGRTAGNLTVCAALVFVFGTTLAFRMVAAFNDRYDDFAVEEQRLVLVYLLQAAFVMGAGFALSVTTTVLQLGSAFPGWRERITFVALLIALSVTGLSLSAMLLDASGLR